MTFLLDWVLPFLGLGAPIVAAILAVLAVIYFGLPRWLIVVAGAAIAAYVAGWVLSSQLGDAKVYRLQMAALQSQLAAAQADLRIDKDARDQASADSAIIEAADRRNQDILNAPPESSNACLAGDDGARWLQSIH